MIFDDVVIDASKGGMCWVAHCERQAFVVLNIVIDNEEVEIPTCLAHYGDVMWAESIGKTGDSK